MVEAIYCLVAPDGRVFVKDGAASYAEIAAEFGLAEDSCGEYRFDFSNRRLILDRPTPASHVAVRSYVTRQFGTPDRLIKFAEGGHLPKQVLTDLLRCTKRQAFDAACADIERRYSGAPTANNDPCLRPGCPVEGGICLQPLLSAGIEYQKACAAEWAKVFRNPRNRIPVWAS